MVGDESTQGRLVGGGNRQVEWSAASNNGALKVEVERHQMNELLASPGELQIFVDLVSNQDEAASNHGDGVDLLYVAVAIGNRDGLVEVGCD